MPPAAILVASCNPGTIDQIVALVSRYPRSTVWDYLQREVKKGTVKCVPGFQYVISSYPCCTKCGKPLTFYNPHWRRHVCGCGKTFAKTFVDGRV